MSERGKVYSYTIIEEYVKTSPEPESEPELRYKGLVGTERGILEIKEWESTRVREPADIEGLLTELKAEVTEFGIDYPRLPLGTRLKLQLDNILAGFETLEDKRRRWWNEAVDQIGREFGGVA